MKKTLVLSLRNAPTDNRRLTWAPHLRRFISSSAYRSWKDTETLSIKNQWRQEPLIPLFESQLPYHVKVYMPSKRTDQVNWDKGARDILTEAGVWDDDKYAYPVYTACELDKLNPRMEITFQL